MYYAEKNNQKLSTFPFCFSKSWNFVSWSCWDSFSPKNKRFNIPESSNYRRKNFLQNIYKKTWFFFLQFQIWFDFIFLDAVLTGPYHKYCWKVFVVPVLPNKNVTTFIQKWEYNVLKRIIKKLATWHIQYYDVANKKGADIINTYLVLRTYMSMPTCKVDAHKTCAVGTIIVPECTTATTVE